MTDLDAPAAARPMTEAEIRWLRQHAEDDVRFPHANLSAHWMRRVLATLDAAVEERDRLLAAAERVVDWADHHEPWNPDGAFSGLYEATGRRAPEGEEPKGPRYYRAALHETPAAARLAILEDTRRG